MSGKTALIFGATGATGRVLLQELLGSASYTLVGEYGRRTTPSDQITVGKDKLRQKVVDFEKLDEAQLNELRWDVVFMWSVLPCKTIDVNSFGVVQGTAEC